MMHLSLDDHVVMTDPVGLLPSARIHFLFRYTMLNVSDMGEQSENSSSYPAPKPQIDTYAWPHPMSSLPVSHYVVL